jgi:hypothetical protein
MYPGAKKKNLSTVFQAATLASRRGLLQIVCHPDTASGNVSL